MTAFVSGATPRLSAILELNTEEFTSAYDFEVRATASNGWTFEGGEVTRDGEQLSVTGLESTEGFEPSLVQYLPSFALDWEVSPDGGTSWRSAGSTTTTLAVTLAPALNVAPLLTPVILGAIAADGESEEEMVTSLIWLRFADRGVMQEAEPVQGGAAPRELSYWKSVVANQPHPNNTVKLLLEKGDGDCNAWSEFFINSLGQHGIFGEKVVVRSIYRHGPGVAVPGLATMLIKNWEFAPNPANPREDGWSYRPAEVTDKDGMKAQGNSNPPSRFSTHAIVRVDGKYYDPSYGGDVHETRESWENASVDGFRRQQLINNLVTLWVARPNTVGLKEVEFWTGNFDTGTEIPG